MPALDLAQTPERLEERLLADLTEPQREAVTHTEGPLLIIAGAGTGKTTVITRRIAWLIATKRARPEDILALTFTDKAAAEMEERVDVLVPYGYLDIRLSTFHAFGDRVLREHALEAGLASEVRVLSKAEQVVFLQQHLFELPLTRLRPLQDPARYLEALATVMSRAKDEAVTPDEFLALAAAREAQAAAAPPTAVGVHSDAALARELAECYAAYHRLLREAKAVDFGGQILLTIWLLEQHPELLADFRRRFRYILVDEFQDTNFAQFRLLQLLATPESNITVVADDDQSIYKWRGAAVSNVLKFLEHYRQVRRVVLTENFRSSQPILDAAYRLIRFNDPDRLEVKEAINKRLTAMCPREAKAPQFAVFDTVSSEADRVARRIQTEVEAGRRAPGDFAILVRTNRDAELFLRALNVCGLPWRFSGTTGLFAREEVKMLVSCLRTLADPEDSLSWYHVISSPLYACPMPDLIACLAQATRANTSLRLVLEQAPTEVGAPAVSDQAREVIRRFLDDVARLQDASRTLSPGQLLYRWLTDTGWLKRHAAVEDAEEVEQLQSVARFFDHLFRFEGLGGNRLPELMRSLDLLQALGESAAQEPDAASMDHVNVLTIHKAKGLEFPVVFLVGLVQGRFPTTLRRDAIELPEPLIKDILPSGDYHLQEERRLFYVGMTRAREELHLTAAYDYGGKTLRKVSQFVLEALGLESPAPPAKAASARERLSRAKPPSEASPERKRRTPAVLRLPEPLRLDAHGLDDYLTCPLKFRYSHVLRLPIMRHHLVIYGAALHKAVEQFFRRRLQGQAMSEEELLQVFEHAWRSEGFLTREHEAQRLAQGRAVLARFYAEQQQRPEQPTLIEEKFSIPLDDLVLVGRWDRVDRRGEEAVIIDYKSSDVTEQAEADQRVRKSLQMQVYALAWTLIHGRLPSRLELRFLETGLVGQTAFTDEDLEKTKARIREAARGIRALEFHPQPSEFACHWCAYQSICQYAVT
ncbi:MAG: ATP-dependent helicase [Candidatus Omnitrophica bacterium]|nr:ATP-dependent helicase [Candidatus Omnitrophota bacterium]